MSRMACYVIKTLMPPRCPSAGEGHHHSTPPTAWAGHSPGKGQAAETSGHLGEDPGDSAEQGEINEDSQGHRLRDSVYTTFLEMTELQKWRRIHGWGEGRGCQRQQQAPHHCGSLLLSASSLVGCHWGHLGERVHGISVLFLTTACESTTTSKIWSVKVKLLSCVRLFATPWTIAY